MWLLVAREPAPDAPYWPGRRWLAAIDAIAWPVAWAVLASMAPPPGGVVVPLVTAWALCSGIGRLRRALWRNHRYCFTTWRWGRVVFGLVLFGMAMRFAMR